MLHALAVLVTGRNDLDPRGVDAAVPEDIRKLGNVFFNAVKRAGKKVAQIVRKHFIWIDVCLFAKAFHLSPDVRAADRLACACHKDRSRCDVLFFGILQQFFLQAFHDENRANLPLAVDGRFTAPDRFHRDELQFTDTDACSADRLNDKIQAVVFLLLCSVDKAQVFRFGQLFLVAAKNLLLQFDGLHLTVTPTEKRKKTVDRGQHGIDAADSIAVIDQLLFVFDCKFFCDLLFVEESGKRFDVAHIFVNGIRALFL